MLFWLAESWPRGPMNDQSLVVWWWIFFLANVLKSGLLERDFTWFAIALSIRWRMPIEVSLC